MPDNFAVVDASALGALLFGEPRAEEMAQRLRERRLVAPTLLRYEVASVCLKKIARHPEQGEELKQAFSLLDKMNLRELEVLHEDVVTLAAGTGLTTYDASYLWLARNLCAELVTLDEKLHRASNRPGRP